MHHTVPWIAVNGIPIAKEKSGCSAFLCSLESHTTLKCSDLILNISHWKDFLNNNDLSRQLCGKNGRKGTYLCLTVSGGCCCQGKGPKSLQAIGRSPSKRREKGFQQMKCFATATHLKKGGISTTSQHGDLRERNLTFLLLLVYSAILDKSCNSSVPPFIFVR